MVSFPIADISNPGGGLGHIQVAAGGDLGACSPGRGTTHTQAEGTKDKISILCLKMPHEFKIKVSVF
jgi:hypothetical protein